MKTTVKTKRVNTLFDFLKTALLPLEQTVAAFFSSTTQTGLSLTPRAETSYNNSNGSKTPFTQSFSMVVVLLSLLFVGTVSAQTNNYTGATGGNWSLGTNWSLGVPTSAHDVVIPDGINVTVDVNAVCNTFAIALGTGNNTVSISGTNSLTVTGAVTIGQPNTTTTLLKSINVGAGTLTCASITLPLSSGATRVCDVTISTGTVTVSGNITMPAQAARNIIKFTGAGLLKVGGTISGTPNSGSIVPSTGTVEYYGDGTGGTTANQTIGTYTYTNLKTSGSGTKTLAANATVNGIVTVNAGTTLALSTFTLGGTATSLALQCGATAGSAITGTGLLTLVGNVAVATAGTGTSGATIATPLALGTATRTFTVANDGTTAADLTISTVISGTGGIIKDGLGTMDVSAANTYSGTTTVTAGILRASNTVQASVAGAFGNSASAASNIILNGGTIQSNTATFSKTITVAVTNSGLDGYGSARTIAAPISIVSGTINLNIGGTSVASAEGQQLTLSGLISNTAGALSLTKIGTSTAIISAANTYGGNTTVSGGTLEYGIDDAIASGAVTVSGGTLDLKTFSDTVGAVTLTSGAISGTTGALTATSYAVESGTISKILAGAVALTKSNSGTVILSGSNTYTGLTTVSAGTLEYGVDNAIASGAVTVSGGTLDMKTFSDTVGAVTLTSGTISGTTGALTATSYAVESGTISKILAGTANLTKTTSGTVTLSGANTYTGTNTISVGTLSINSTTALGAATNNLTIAVSAVANVDANVTVGQLTLGGVVGSNGTWGFTGSGATNIDATYFTSTAGVITSSYTLTTPTVTVTPIGTYTYNGSSQGPNAATNTGTGTSYTFSYVGVSGTTYSASATRPKNAGSYTVTATVAADAAYGVASSVATPFTIGTVAIEVTAASNTKTFDNFTTSAITPSITSGALQGSDTSGFTQTYDNKNVGTNKTLTPTGIVNDGNSGNNYVVTFVASNTGAITAKAVTVTGATTANKVYDGNNVAIVTGGTLSGVISPNVVTFSGSGTYASVNVGTALAITSTSTLGGADAGNYSLTQPSLTARNITAIPLTVTGASAVNRNYDKTTVVAVTGGSLVGVILSEDVTLTQSGTISTTGTGVARAVTATCALGGTAAGNYSLTQPTGLTVTISPRPLTITGATVATKAYNGNTTAIVTGGVLVGVISGDTTTLTTQSGTFSSKDVGTWPVTATCAIGGAGNANYSLTQPTLANATITPAVLTIGGTSANKVYDGTSTATLSTGTLSGVVAGETVNLTLIVNYYNLGVPTKAVGNGYSVISTSTIASGNINTDINNYTLTQPTLTARNITAKALTITGTTTVDKVYTKTNTAILSDGVLSGVVSGDVVTLTLSGTYSSVNAGGPYNITSTSTISGADNANYTLTQPTGLTQRSITPAPLTIVGATTADKAYNGNTTAVVTGGTLVGLVSGDSVTLTQAGIFPGKDVGGPFTITPNFSITNTNYSLTQPALNNASITPKALTISGNSQNKVYDGTSTATLSGATAGALVGVVAGETVNLTLILNYYSAPGVTVRNVGNGYAVTSTSTIASGNINTDVNNYTLTQPTLTVRNITKKALTITGTTTVDKVYDRTSTAILTDGVLNGVVLGDDVTLVLSGRYASSNAGGPYIMTSTSTILGADIANYSVTQPTDLTQRSISKVTLTIDGATSIDKQYDGTTTAAATGGSLVGVVSGDNITLTQAGIYTNSDKNVGGPYPVTPNFSIGGTAAINYDLIQVSSLADSSITPKQLTIVGTSQNKIYDGTSIATLQGDGAGTLAGVVAGETVTLNLIVNYYSAPGVTSRNFSEIGFNHQVISTSTISSGDINTDINNYTLIQPTLPTKRIFRRPLTIQGVTASNKVYDGTTTAPIDVSGASLVVDPVAGIVPGDDVTFNPASAATAFFDTKDIGIDKPLTSFVFVLEGADFNNYRLYNPILTASITERAITITANDIAKCGESTYTFTGTEFTSDFPVPGDITSVTLTSAGAGLLAGVGSYPITVSNAVGPSVSNYTFSYAPGTLVVNPIPTATMSSTSLNCLSQLTQVTFTGSNGTSIENYKFYYTIDGTPYTVSTLPGNNTVTVNVPSNAVRSFVYVLTDVEDVNTSCSKVISGASITVAITLCTQLRPIQCGKTMNFITDAIQASPIIGATEYTFEVTRTDNNVVDTVVWPNYYFFPATKISGGLVYGKSYSIKVKAKIGGGYGAYGNTCIVTAPAEPLTNTLTKVRPMQCGKTLNFITDAIQASPVYLATQYEFEVTDGVTTIVIPSNTSWFRLSQFPGGGVLSTAYTIRVRSKGAATAFTAWGDPCVVSTPIARLSEVNDVFEVKSFPNPFASHFNLDIESSSDAQVEMKVYDMIGRQLEVRKSSVSELSVLEIGGNYPSGVYNLVVSQGDKVKSIRMVKR
ncbi:YDG domain-containing protein [Flavobacterium luteum]|uniref:T9SS type A sorting domain-containing protein n=1 Tax=Flavobacterium luteum TaxID=2026654 RepID=A0A7J5A8Z5_9FLAO|nr:YDG domain-containing protein [Flavobacterium luteum]KAB1154044.1 T9SS type A sorting domain-containing protein [Flavobacterium luteum]